MIDVSRSMSKLISTKNLSQYFLTFEILTFIYALYLLIFSLISSRPN